MKLIAIGDNVADCYIDEKVYLDFAAERSALTCTIRGGFGHPHIL